MNSEYKITIGLEIHAELKTMSKMWCGCKNDPYDSKPNTHICPVCMAEPGTLPVPNHEAVEKVIQVGLALNSNIADFTEFDRKNYFYPDIPKGYQISQYKFPIVSGGSLAGVDITRVHLEEDTAKSTHDQGAYTLIDFNRAGVPLMELVTEACIHSAQQASTFAKELQLILRTLGASDANMEMGQMRVEVNFSVSKDPNVLGTKVEVKNLNSFKTVEKAIEYEYKRHTELLEAGRGSEIVQETRGWDENKQVTFSQRKKESAHDYRYFPDPDLPKLYLQSMFDLNKMKSELPELPAERRSRLSALGLKDETVEVLVNEINLSHYFDAVTTGQEQAFISLAANYLTSDIIGLLKKENKEVSENNLPPVSVFQQLMHLVLSNKLSSRSVKDTLLELCDSSKEIENLEAFYSEKGLLQKNDTAALEVIVQGVIDANPTQWTEYTGGNDKLLMFFVGQAMKASKGSGNPGLFQEIIASKK
jgi:aspartyl-tRNA(Asn)/glutamyl-tRNA(Gln) amidotransferase subunit B